MTTSTSGYVTRLLPGHRRSEELTVSDCTPRPATVRAAAIVTRDGKWWMVDVPGVGLTQARRLGEVETMARNLVAVVQDVDEADVVVEVRYAPVEGLDIAGRLKAIEEDRRLAAEYDRRVREQTRDLARALAERHVPQRDIGAVLGVSGQRANQLLSA